MRAGLALPLLLLTLPTAAFAQDDPPTLRVVEPSTLNRAESPVVVQGSTLRSLLGVPKAELRLFAFSDGELRAIPFQIDERVPEGRYAHDHGEERGSDTDDGQVDANDELVFMARDAGARIQTSGIRLGQTAHAELSITDPSTKARGWAYLLHFATAPPPLAPSDYISLDWKEGEIAGWVGDRVRIVGPPSGNNFLQFHEMRFTLRRGGYGPDVLDRAKLSLRASYLFLDINRKLDEIRAQIVSYTDGPVRIVGNYEVEAYMIWGHWIRSTRRCRIKIYGNRLELDTELSLPVTLETSPQGVLRFSLDFAPTAGEVHAWSNTNPRGVLATGRGGQSLRALDRSMPAWLCVSLPSGSILARLGLSGGLQQRSHSLFMADGPTRDPPEEYAGSLGNTGFALDLTALPAGNHRFKLTLQFGPSLQPGEEARLLAVDDAPLEVAEVSE